MDSSNDNSKAFLPSCLNGKALVVEDDNLNQKLITHIISHLGFEVTVAEDGEEGLQKALEGDFDIILMDQNLPKKDGSEVTKILREHKLSTPIIAITATCEEKQLGELIDAGCDEYLCKPFDKKALITCLKQYFTPTKSSLKDTKGYAKLISEYIQSLDERIRRARHAYREEDWDGLRREAHRLSGAGLFGFKKLGEIAKRIQEGALIQSDEKLDALMQQLEDEVAVIEMTAR